MLAGRRSEFLARYEGRLALGAALVATILFGALALLRHWTFHSTASDLAVFDQVMWNTVHGRFMESTISLARCEPHSFFGDHFSPALLLLVPPYALFPHPETLIVAQTISLALGVADLSSRAPVPSDQRAASRVGRGVPAQRAALVHRSLRLPRDHARGRAARIRDVLPRDAADRADGPLPRPRAAREGRGRAHRRRVRRRARVPGPLALERGRDRGQHRRVRRDAAGDHSRVRRGRAVSVPRPLREPRPR